MATASVVPLPLDPAVSRIDLSVVQHHLTRSPNAIMSAEDWPAAELEYRQFLTLRSRFPGRLLIPSGKALSIWQAHILDTRAYRVDCEDAFGRYLDHFPYLGELDSADLAERETGLQNFATLTRQYLNPNHREAPDGEPPLSGSGSSRTRSMPTIRRLVLVALPWQQDGHQAIPLGHASILARLQSEPSLNVASIVRPVNATEFSSSDVADEILEAVGESDAGAVDVAIGAYVWNDRAVREIVANLRQRSFNGRIILGGPQISYAGVGLEALYPGVSAFIRGAGEEALCALTLATDSSAIPGVHVAGTTDNGVQAKSTLQGLPSPWLTGVIDPSTSKSVHWESQRGCPYACSFCQHRQPGRKAKFAKISIQRIAEEIDLLCTAGTQRISILDPVFNLDLEHASSILHEFIDRGFTGELSLQCRAEKISLKDSTFLDAAEKLNVTLEFGIQSVIEAEFLAVRRNNKLRDISAVLDEVQKRGIPHEVSLIYGLPEQTLSSFRESVDWCLQHRIPVVRAFPLLLLRGTELHDQRARWQLVVRDDALPTVISSSTFSESDWLAMEEIANALANAAELGACPVSVDELMSLYRPIGRPEVGPQQHALGRIQ